MVENLRLGFSSCPNDTYIFFGLVNGKIPFPGFRINECIHDIEVLNGMVERGELDVSKISIHALMYTLDNYALLGTGSALGRGVGPLIVAKPGKKLENICNGKIASPGRYTTAQLLLELYSGQRLDTRFMVFDEIMPAVQRGETDYGVIIHEGRFTYQEYGLTQLLDLGSWWESVTALPPAVGGNSNKEIIGRQNGPIDGRRPGTKHPLQPPKYRRSMGIHRTPCPGNGSACNPTTYRSVCK